MDSSHQTIVSRDKVGFSPSCGSIQSLKDDRLLWVWAHHGSADAQPVMANYSSDTGVSWSDPIPLKLANGHLLRGVIAPSLIRLPGGALGLAIKDKGSCGRRDTEIFHVSRDEGETWSEGTIIRQCSIHTQREGPTVDAMVRLTDGRILIAYPKILGPTPKNEKPKVTAQFGESFGAGFLASMY